MRSLRRGVFLLIGLTLLISSALGVMPARAAARADKGATLVFDTRASQDVSTQQFVPCADGGLGEDVALSGTQQFRQRVTSYSDGSFRLEERTKLDGIVGVGESTGDTYRVKGELRDKIRSFTSFPLRFESTYKFQIRSKTSDVVLRIEEKVRGEIDANGNTTLRVDVQKIACEG